MGIDADLDWILDDISALIPAEPVTLLAGSGSCRGLFDDGESIGKDGFGQDVQTLETIVRYREGAITRPTVGSTVTLQWAAASGNPDQTFLVDEARKDPGNPGVIRLLLRRT
jgi:hypothetical protein